MPVGEGWTQKGVGLTSNVSSPRWRLNQRHQRNIKDSSQGCVMIAPPLLVSYNSVDDYLNALPDELRTVHENDIVRLAKHGFPPVRSSRCLATLFGYSVTFLNALHKNNSRYYRQFSIKSGKKLRTIHSPKIALKVIQKWFGHHISQAMPMPDHVFGFIECRSSIDAAATHCGARWVYSLDIQNFFHSIKLNMVEKSLVELGYTRHAANLIASLCCFKDCLPQGSPASPPLSNLVFQNTDEKLKTISTKYDVTYTRYADDIVFSGSEEFTSGIKSDIYAALTIDGWKLSEDKEYFSDSAFGKRLKVHGLLVHGENVRLTKGYRNRIRAYKHLIETKRVKQGDIRRLQGHVNYSSAVDKRAAR